MEAPRVIREHKGKISMGSIAAAIGIYLGVVQLGMDPLAEIHTHPEMAMMDSNQKRIIRIIDRVEAENVERDLERLVTDCTADGVAHDICWRRAKDEMRRRRAVERSAGNPE